MQIVIFKSNKNKSSSYKINGLFFISIISLSVISLSFCFTTAAYFYGFNKGYTALNEDRIEDISSYQHDIKLIKKQNKQKMQFFSQKLITISAELENLNSLGNKISNIAKLDKKNFDFKNPKYIGGKNKINIELVDLAIKQEDLNNIYKIVNNMEMKEQFFPSGFPSSKGYISSQYGERVNPITKKTNLHKGIDIAHKLETDIKSLAGGVISYSGKKYGYGNFIEISHLNGYTTRYAHNNRNLVQEGDIVRKGQIIAKMGSTGHSTGPHVHLEVLKNNIHINPNKFIHYKEKFSKNN